MTEQTDVVPGWITNFLARKNKHGATFDEDEQVVAGREIQDLANAEKDPHLREYINDCVQKPGSDEMLSDLAVSLPSDLDDLRELKGTLPPVSLLVDMERVAAFHADAHGYSFTFGRRSYPTRFPKGASYDETRNVPHDISPLRIAKAWYQLGRGRFYVGAAMVEIIALLKERYQLDFDELERRYQERFSEETARLLGVAD